MTAFKIFAVLASSIAILQIALITIYILIRCRRRRKDLESWQSNNGENEHIDNIRSQQMSPSNRRTTATITLSVSQFVSSPPPPYQTCHEHSLPVTVIKNDLSDLPTYNQAIISDSDFHFSSKS